jgi:hypothetical protein
MKTYWVSGGISPRIINLGKRWATGWTIGGSSSVRGWKFFSSLHHRVQTDSEAHPASYPLCTRGSLPRGKAVGE